VCVWLYSKCIKNFAKFVLTLKIGEKPDKFNVQLNQVFQIIWSDSFFRRVVFVKFLTIFRQILEKISQKQLLCKNCWLKISETLDLAVG
jgi:hypothetical protein